jgi:hypothetical protein
VFVYKVALINEPYQHVWSIEKKKYFQVQMCTIQESLRISMHQWAQTKMLLDQLDRPTTNHCDETVDAALSNKIQSEVWQRHFPYQQKL